MKKMIESKGNELVVGDSEEPLLSQKMAIALVLEGLFCIDLSLLWFFFFFFQHYYLIINPIIFI